MKNFWKRFLCLMMLGAVLCFSQPNLVQAQENMVSIMSVQNNRCMLNLSFNSKTASCQLVVKGRNGTSSISGTLKLYDSTEGKTVKTWSISKSGSVYSGTKTAAVKKGHSYKLSFSGKVYGKNAKYGESVSASASRKN
ncbi:hypothetical protein [Roseburia sp. 1XD42-69]|uniref:hypothetical protein n=1 Tax=Roseburia sp. 1XD42-69 TaxID=2320088 RepID=UPI000EA3FBE0|nr:hypothetical protein [Roseburia sp. 1XD42-69]RKJ67413.1 hypothetical protein D7Y06_05030 [Roseburia sp. 1XD42-69]